MPPNHSPLSGSGRVCHAAYAGHRCFRRLYARNMIGEEFWCAGQYSFGDTIRYAFNNLVYGTANKTGYEYRLYLPLYNTVR